MSELMLKANTPELETKPKSSIHQLIITFLKMFWDNESLKIRIWMFTSDWSY